MAITQAARKYQLRTAHQAVDEDSLASAALRAVLEDQDVMEEAESEDVSALEVFGQLDRHHSGRDHYDA